MTEASVSPRTAGKAAGRRPPLLIALQTEATILMSLSIGQAGLAAAFISKQAATKGLHEANAFVLLGLAVITVLTAILYQRRGGPIWMPLAAVLLLILIGAQIGLGESKVAGVHIFLGVIYVVLATLFTSYLFRPGFSASRR